MAYLNLKDEINNLKWQIKGYIKKLQIKQQSENEN